MARAAELLDADFGTFSDLVHAHGRERPDHVAVIDAAARTTYRELDRMIDRIAAALQRDGLAKGDCVAILALPCAAYVAVMIGTLRAGGVPAPLAPSATPAQLRAMIADCGARMLFADAAGVEALGDDATSIVSTVQIDQPLDSWLVDVAEPAPVAVGPADAFTIIYSSGTTGTPKGIVQSHAMRWAYVRVTATAGFSDAVTIVATPLYSNTTNVTWLPTLAYGGTLVLMAKFDARRFLELAAQHRATHVMLVPVQYQRIMADPTFDRFDLTSFQLKACTSAPFSPALKRDVLARWPGLLVEYYGMTEGGGSTMLIASYFPDKLHTVGRPMEGHDIRLIDDEGHEVPPGATGEVVSRSPARMSGYHNRDDATQAATWIAPDGTRFIRHGDIGRFDADGFLILMDRKKDLIISGGFNIYPSDLEAVLATHPAVADCTVIGVPSDQWGETPVGVFVPRRDADAAPDEILAWFNAQVGKTQRLSALHAIEELPRSAIGKVLKRELRDRFAREAA
ncbi:MULTISPECIES: class I adenylate-forming enzyme family protein [unclassified Sphingomonas]|jgi:acyl-CoA synthetase (AMP-forming)/AMP-acid ligase II|uniref:class I adenylate-forming enzyme family protein n=1 Tax=unclassified Sphingomonas TaxID=196159 RepID=UPI00082E1109|nr:MULTISPECIES: class I adenylate-forming enzyme family protein [unclassified Sphingomonas]